MGRRNQPHIDLDGTAAADTFQLAFLQHAQQLGLEGRRDLADLVEEQRAAVGRLETALARIDRAGEGPLLVAEEFGLEQVFRQRSAIEAHVGAACARRVVVDGVGDEFLAGAGLATDQHRGRPFCHHADLLENAPHRRRMANQVVEAVLLAHGASQGVALFGQRLAVKVDFQRQAHALADQVGDHFDETHPLCEQTVVGCVGLHRENALQRAADLDRRGDEGQILIVEAEPVEETRLVPQALDGNCFPAFEDHADETFARLVVHCFVGFAVEAEHHMHVQLAGIGIHHADHAAAIVPGDVQRAQHFAQGLVKIQRA